MTAAIFEILFLLSVSCFIGFFFTYRYWTTRYEDVQSQIRQLWVNLSEKNMQIKALEAKSVKENKTAKPSQAAALTEVREKIQEESETLTIEVDDKNISELEEKLEKSKKALDAEKAKNKELSEQLAASKQKTDKAVKITEPKKTTSLPKDKKEIKQLKESIVLINEELNEKEREIEELSKELSAKKISYYKQIDGKRYKAITLKIADESVSGQGDGRISKEDAEKIFETISDGIAYTQVEKHTMKYLRDNYKWTEGADQLFRSKVRSWAAKGHHLD
jgi:hypothetical protein